RLPRRRLRLGLADGLGRGARARAGAGRLPVGRSGARAGAVRPLLRAALQDANAGDPRRARLPRAGDAGLRVLRNAAHARRPEPAGLLPGREPLDPEAAELPPLVRAVLRLDRAVRAARWAVGV